MLAEPQQAWGSVLAYPPNVTPFLSRSRWRAHLPNGKRPAAAPTRKLPALKVVASQHHSLEALSQAQQHWGFALL